MTTTAEYMREYRKDPVAKRREKEMRRAERLAMTRLRRLHHPEYYRMYAEELGKIRRGDSPS
jgi:hypothetical protein